MRALTVIRRPEHALAECLQPFVNLSPMKSIRHAKLGQVIFGETEQQLAVNR